MNSKDSCESYHLFWRLYRDYSKAKPLDFQPNVPDHIPDPTRFDFYSHLYAVSRKPGLYLGSGERVQLLAAYLAGYFKGKQDGGIKLTPDEARFFRFEEWLRRFHKFTQKFPWYRTVEMWSYGGLNSFESFFAYYDAYLTYFGKQPGDLHDLIELVSDKGCTTIRRRKKPPKSLILIEETKLWWRAERRKA